MHKRPSYWPAERSLFRDKGKRRHAVVWVLVVFSVACAAVVAALWRHPLT